MKEPFLLVEFEDSEIYLGIMSPGKDTEKWKAAVSDMLAMIARTLIAEGMSEEEILEAIKVGKNSLLSDFEKRGTGLPPIIIEGNMG